MASPEPTQVVFSSVRRGLPTLCRFLALLMLLSGCQSEREDAARAPADDPISAEACSAICSAVVDPVAFESCEGDPTEVICRAGALGLATVRLADERIEKIEYDKDDDGSADEIHDFEYDDAGRVLVLDVDRGADGQVDARSQYEYVDQGWMKSMQIDDPVGGDVETRFEYVYEDDQLVRELKKMGQRRRVCEHPGPCPPPFQGCEVACRDE